MMNDEREAIQRWIASLSSFIPTPSGLLFYDTISPFTMLSNPASSMWYASLQK
ncbi:MAG: hypothetical protein QOD00_405 [Blastocatellia bacterium]|jgi:hypothetical protein|nr:hypothetical protein [Blastocatellia bacterium]